MEKIFSGDYSRNMWEDINNADSIEKLKDALGFVCARIQELETKIDNLERGVSGHGKARHG